MFLSLAFLFKTPIASKTVFLSPFGFHLFEGIWAPKEEERSRRRRWRRQQREKSSEGNNHSSKLEALGRPSLESLGLQCFGTLLLNSFLPKNPPNPLYLSPISSRRASPWYNYHSFFLSIPACIHTHTQTFYS